MGKLIAILAGAAVLVLSALPAAAGCTLGHKQCNSGWLHVCERCGSETCWIFKGTKCVKDDERDLPAHAEEGAVARALLATDAGRVEFGIDRPALPRTGKLRTIERAGSRAD